MTFKANPTVKPIFLAIYFLWFLDFLPYFLNTFVLQAWNDGVFLAPLKAYGKALIFAIPGIVFVFSVMGLHRSPMPCRVPVFAGILAVVILGCAVLMGICDWKKAGGWDETLYKLDVEKEKWVRLVIVMLAAVLSLLPSLGALSGQPQDSGLHKFAPFHLEEEDEEEPQSSKASRRV